jgi:hypothetical protein
MDSGARFGREFSRGRNLQHFRSAHKSRAETLDVLTEIVADMGIV